MKSKSDRECLHRLWAWQFTLMTKEMDIILLF